MINNSRTLVITDQPELYHGITGNFYVVCTEKQQLVEICEQINKSKNSIKWVDKYNAFVIRCKSRKHKNLVKQLFKQQDN